MILYHFTCVEYLDSIFEFGLLPKGEVVTDSWRNISQTALWLTTDNDPTGHGLCDERIFTDEDRAAFQQVHGRPAAANAMFPNKRAVRIAVDIPARDENLVRWMRWAQRSVRPDLRQDLIDTGGGMRKARTWYLYRDIIQPASFAEVLVYGTPLEWEQAA
jgi:hypothetical protein